MEEKFKDVSEACTTSEDEEQRKEYDNIDRMVNSGGFRGFPRRFSGRFVGLGNIRVEDLTNLFGGRTRRSLGLRRGGRTWDLDEGGRLHGYYTCSLERARIIKRHHDDDLTQG